MKIINASITVLLDTSLGRPSLVEWNGQTYSVMNIVDDWKVRTKWWADEVTRHYMILSTDSHLMEVYLQNNCWTLYRIHD